MNRIDTYEALVQGLAQCRQLALEANDLILSYSIEDRRLDAALMLKSLKIKSERVADGPQKA